MKPIVKWIMIITVTVLTLAYIVFLFYYVKPNSDYFKNREKLTVKPVTSSDGIKNAIHFLPTGTSDTILIESDGHFALVDCGEDTDNPRGFEALELPGFEDDILDYLKKNASDENGEIHLDFILGTHSHSDHLGGFDTIIADKNVFVDRAYLKRYDESRIRSSEIEEWDNKEVYEQTVNALNEKNIPIISDITEKQFKLGEMNITLFNTEYETEKTDIGENDNSIGTLVELYGKKVFLAADIDNKTGDEDRLAPEIGKVDILKVGHHSYSGSTTPKWLKTLSPDVCVVTNDYERTDKNTLRRITRICHSPILVTGSENGVIVAFNGDGSLSYYKEIV
jgi:beta-lactamase superfamily II metal-dependent hydrolase